MARSRSSSQGASQGALWSAPPIALRFALALALLPAAARAAEPGTLPEAEPSLPLQREVLLELGARRLSLIENGQVVGRWPVAIGDPRTPTPTGRFQVRSLVVNPQYQSTHSGRLNPTVGANGPLGDRWIGFLESGPNQYGIHGTPSAWAWAVRSRAAVSNGCVRMLQEHVHELFPRLELGTPVVVRP